jgi:hypothetical protein
MKFIALFLLYFTCPFFFGQTNDAFSHSAVIVDSLGVPRANESFVVEIRIQEGKTANDELKYAERHTTITDSLGWYSVKVGNGVTSDLFNVLSEIDWSKEKKYLYVKVSEPEGRTVSWSITQILESPRITFANSIENKALLTLNCITNLKGLREFAVPANGTVICVKGHTKIRDGGEGFFYFMADLKVMDDDGIIIKPKEIDQDRPGRWVRQVNGPINVNYYGATGGPTSTNVADKIQRAINYAASNKYNDWNPQRGGSDITKGNTVFIPTGDYVLDKALVIKDGVALIGEGFNTFLSAKSHSDIDYILKMDAGRIICRIEKLVLNGNSRYADAGGIHFEGRRGPNGIIGGASRSTFKDLEIINFSRHGIFLEAQNVTEGALAIDHQFNVFQNIQIRRMSASKSSLYIKGACTENVFIECAFEGDRDMQPTLGANVLMDNIKGRSVGLSFINCGFGLAEYGMFMKGAENITLDTCWFENIFTAIRAEDSKNINLIGSRFANACGYGSEPPNDRYEPGGHCVIAQNSSINIEKSYVTISSLAEEEAFESNFIYGQETLIDSTSYVNTNTINSRDNHFRDPRLSKTTGIVKRIPVSGRAIILDASTNVAANFDGTSVLKRMESTASGGQYITLQIFKPQGNGIIKIKDWQGNGRKGNIALDGLAQLKLRHGQTVTFLKVDPPISNNNKEPIYYLTSVLD